MIETLTNISLFLGFIIKTAAEILFVLLGLFGIIYLIDKHTPQSKCNGDCNQGRNCTCKDQ